MGWTDWISPFLEGVGAVGSAWSAYMAGDADSRNAEAQAALYRQNAGWAQYEADAIRKIAQQNWSNANSEASRLEGIAESNARMIERLSLMQARGTTLIAGFNADSAIIDSEFDALAVERAAARKSLDMKRESNQLQGAQVASYAKANVEMSGTPMVVLNETIRLAEEDISNVLEGGRLESETLRMRGQMTAALTRGSAEIQAGLLAMQGQHEASMAREEGMLAADRLRWSADVEMQSAELQAKRSEAMAGIYGSQASGMLDAASNSSLMGGVSSALTIAQGAAKLLGNKTVADWLGLGTAATPTATAAGLGASAPEVGSSAWAGFGSPATTATTGAAGAGVTAAAALPSGSSAYLGGMWGGSAAGGGTTATGTMAGVGAVAWPFAIIAAMGIASQFLAKATDSSHTPQTAREYIASDLAYISRYSGLLAQGIDTTYPYVGSDYSPISAALWQIRQLYQRAGYTEDQVLGMLSGAGWSQGLPTKQPRMHWEYDEGTYG